MLRLLLSLSFFVLFFSSSKIHFQSEFVDKICLVLTCLHFYLWLCTDARDKKKSSRVYMQHNRWQYRSETFSVGKAGIFLHSMNAGSMAIVPGTGSTMKVSVSSYGRMIIITNICVFAKPKIVEWIILFAHYIKELNAAHFIRIQLAHWPNANCCHQPNIFNNIISMLTHLLIISNW